MAENLKLYAKIYGVMNESEAVQKLMTVGSGNNSYRAVSEASMLNLVKPLFKKFKLIIFPVDGDIKDNMSVWEKTDTYKGTVKNDLRAITELKVYYKIVDIESGESETLVGFGNGADPQDKGAGKAFTYSFKNVLSKTFMLFSGEDTDSVHSDDINKETKKDGLNPKEAPKYIPTKPPYKAPQSTGNVHSVIISDGQQKRLYAISKGNNALAKKVLQKYNYASSKSVENKDYKAICEEIEKLVGEK